MKIVVNGIVALNPHIVRVTVYTYTGELSDNTAEEFKYYELAVPIEEFTENDGQGNVGIDGDKFQQVITNRVVAAQNAANLAVYMDTLNLEWDVVVNQPLVEKKEEVLEGKLLAYGGDSNENTES